MTGSSRVTLVAGARRSPLRRWSMRPTPVVTAMSADVAEPAPALKLSRARWSARRRAPLTIELLRWSTDAERAPLLAALAAPPPAPPAQRCRGRQPARRGGRGGRGGRGCGAAAESDRRLTTAIKAAPTLGYIWSDGRRPATRSSTRGAPRRRMAPSASSS